MLSAFLSLEKCRNLVWPSLTLEHLVHPRVLIAHRQHSCSTLIVVFCRFWTCQVTRVYYIQLFIHIWPGGRSYFCGVDGMDVLRKTDSYWVKWCKTNEVREVDLMELDWQICGAEHGTSMLICHCCSEEGVKVGVNDFLIKAVAVALQVCQSHLFIICHPSASLVRVRL